MKLITFREFPAKHSAFSEGGLRSLRFNEKTNGFEGVFVNVGRRVYIDEDAFFKAVERRNGLLDRKEKHDPKSRSTIPFDRE